MGDSYGDPQKGRNFDNARGGFRNGRNSGGRESGGFRIRLSDNEMRASRTIQEAFNLRSTVAVLGFALRTLAQMIEDGKIDDLITEYRAQTPESKQNKFNAERGGRRSDNQSSSKHSKPNPFARPEKPAKEQEVTDADQASNVSQDLVEKDNDQATEASSNEDDSTNTSEQG